MHHGETPGSLGAAIKRRRQELGWSQEALAERVAEHGDAAFRQSDVSRLELGKVELPHRERLTHIAAVLDLSLGELLACSGWTGAGVAFAGEATTPVVEPPPIARVTNRLPVEASPVDLPISAHARTVPVPYQEFNRLRQVIARAEATRTRTKEILAQCEQLDVLYEGPGRARKSR